MNSLVRCPGCGFEAHIATSTLDLTLTCPRCQAQVHLPASQAPAAPDNQGHPVDQLFAQLLPQMPALRHPELVPTANAIGDSAPAPGSPEAERLWLNEERQRLDAYSANQLAALAQQRGKLVDLQSKVEARQVSREQELNRLQKQLDHHAEELRQREQKCAGVESALTEQRGLLAGAEEDVRRRRQERTELEVQVAELAGEADRLHQATEDARREYGILDETIRDREQAHALEDVLRDRQRLECEQRLASLSSGEKALEQRTAELDRLEERIREELEARDRQRRLEWQQRMTALAKGEQALERRAAELDQLEERIRAELEERERQLIQNERFARDRAGDFV